MTIIRKLYIPLSILLNILFAMKVIKQRKHTSIYHNSYVKSAFSNSYSSPKHLLEQSINQARWMLDIAIYNFDESTISNYLIKAKKRGVQIRILIDAKKATKKNVAEIISLLTKAGISVRLHTSEKMHLKMAIIDQKTLVTGSFNYTDASVNENIEQLFRISNQTEARKWTAVFNELWQKNLK